MWVEGGPVPELSCAVFLGTLVGIWIGRRATETCTDIWKWCVDIASDGFTRLECHSSLLVF